MFSPHGMDSYDVVALLILYSKLLVFSLILISCILFCISSYSSHTWCQMYKHDPRASFQNYAFFTNGLYQKRP